MDLNTYEYKDLELTPLRATPLVLEFLGMNSRPQKRKDIIKYVEDAHGQRGGLSAKNTTNTLKKCLQNLASEKNILKHGNGEYSLNRTFSPEEITLEYPSTAEEFEDLSADEDLMIEETIGSGAETVYLYYDSAYQELAELKNIDYWACKIGMTAGTSLKKRLLEQGIKTAFHKLPKVGLVIKSDDAMSVEKSLHKALDLAGCRIEDSLGAEWFYTSPKRIKDWYTDYMKITQILGNSISSEST